MLKGKTVLIAGGAGFLGSHLVDLCLRQGAQVICLDNFCTGSIRNLDHLSGNPFFEMVRHDITFPYYAEVDVIFNLACPASPEHYQKDPVATVKANIHGAINLLGLAKRTGALIFQASTSEVYGDPEIHPQLESYWGRVNPIGLRSCYDEGKRCAETLFFDYHRQHGVQIKIARIFNTYGPRMSLNDGRVVSNFIVQALLGEPITIYGSGEQTRSFCFVDDLLAGFMKLIAADSSKTGPFNLGNQNEITIRSLAEKIIELSGSSSVIEYRPLPSDDPVRRKPDISHAVDQLDWQPIVALDEGLSKTVAYFDTLLSSSAPDVGLRLER